MLSKWCIIVTVLWTVALSPIVSSSSGENSDLPIEAETLDKEVHLDSDSGLASSHFESQRLFSSDSASASHTDDEPETTSQERNKRDASKRLMVKVKLSNGSFQYR
jgi:hypothetical protein